MLNEIESAYRLVLRELRSREEDAMGECLGKMRSGGPPGTDLNVLRRAGGQLADDAVSRCEAALPRIISAHIDAGEFDAKAIAEVVREKFVDVALRGLPGAGLYVSVRGGAAAVAQGTRLRQSEEVRFAARRASLRASVEDHVVAAIAARRRQRRLDQVGVETERPAVRQKDQKFGILDSPAHEAEDFESACGLLGRAVVYFDIDNFKSVNTRFTERVVDRAVLPQLQHLVAGCAAGAGHAYAEGGDEMVVYLPNASLLMGAAFAESLRTAIVGRTFDVDGTGLRLTASFGVAASTELAGSQLAEFANLAKRAAKAAGKNRVVIWTNDAPVPFSGSELFGSPVALAVGSEVTDASGTGTRDERVENWRVLLVEAREKSGPVELNSPLEIELDQSDTAGRRIRVDLPFDRPITVWQVQEPTFDLGIRLRGAATPTIARVPFSQVDDIWPGETALNVSLRKVLLLRNGTFVLVDPRK